MGHAITIKTHKPHLFLHKGLWRAAWAPRRGALRPNLMPWEYASFMTRHSKEAMDAHVWVASRNARILATRGPWNCRSVLHAPL